MTNFLIIINLWIVKGGFFMSNKLSVSLYERLISEAEFGLYYFYARITLKEAANLTSLGFVVTDCFEHKGFPRLHKICWKCAGVGVFDYENIDILDENNMKYSLAQRLWIISEKNQPSIKQLYG